jgi:hypothetical protein
MTRAEAAKIFAVMFGLEEEADVSQYEDLNPDAWYMPYIKKCVARGILNGTNEAKTLMEPDATLTREMYFVMFARALGLAGETNQTVKIADSSSVSDWAMSSIQALVNHGYVKGSSTNADGSVNVSPQGDLERCASVSLLSQTVTTYVKNDGDVEVEDEGLVLIIAKNVNVKSDKPITVVVSEPEATVSLKEVTAEVDVIVVDDKVEITDAPVGTTVTATEKVTETIVNDVPVKTNTTSTNKSETITVSHVHTYDAGKVTKAATCTATGIKTYTCTTCDNTKTEEIPIVAHSWNAGEVTTPASCTTTGVKTYKCAAGGETKTEEIPATGHDLQADGKCTKCDATYKVYLNLTADGTKTVSAGVDANYKLNAYVPAITSVTKVTGAVQLSGVSALGSNGSSKKTIEKTFDSAKTVDVSNITGFKGGTINITANDKTCKYTLSKAANGQITGAPDSLENAQAVWQGMVDGLGTDGLSLSGLKNKLSGVSANNGVLTVKLDSNTKTIEIKGNADVVSKIASLFTDIYLYKDNITEVDILNHINTIAGAMNNSTGTPLNITYNS